MTDLPTVTSDVPKLPEGWTLVGKFDSYMSEDMIEAHCGRLLVYCGWYPDGDPAGRYEVGALHGCDGMPGGRIPANSIAEAVSIIETLVRNMDCQRRAEPVDGDACTSDRQPA